jgi:S-DNA-T family DNA segregation ATPase FtsK/SpoIIIE
MSTTVRKPVPRQQSVAPPRGGSRRRSDTLGIILVAAAVLSAMALYRPSLTGLAGHWMHAGLRYLFGVGSWAVAGLLAYTGILHISDTRHRPPADTIVGGALVTVVILWLLQAARVGISLDIAPPPDFARGGGIVGAALVAGLDRLVGPGGSWVVAAALMLGALILIVDLPLHVMASSAGGRARRGATAVRRGAARVRSSVGAVRGRQPAIIENPFGGQDAARQPERKSALPAVVTPKVGQPYVPPTIASEPTNDKPVPKRNVKVRQNALELADLPPAPQDGTYVLPSLDLLEPTAPRPVRSEQEAREVIETLETTLAQFNIEAKVVEIAVGPTVTRYEIQLAPGIKVSKIVSLADNLAMALAAIDVRVEAPIPGKSAIGIEVPNRHPAVVGLRQCLETREFFDAPGKLTFVVGLDVEGRPRYADLAKMPHLLIGGSTNSGKSVGLNALIASLVFRARPDEVKLLLIDPKRVELSLYDHIPHLIYPVVKDVKQAAGILRWAIKEMEHRYDLFVKASARNITSYNEKLPEDEKPLPFIVIIIDELADLMMQQGAEVEGHICRLAQLARATGIHLVIATQRPSVDVITGTIKANIGSRIAYAVASHTDSRTILNMNGAERLIGRGDLLCLPMDAPKPVRLQGPFLSEREIERLVAHLRAQGRPEYTAQVMTVDTAAGTQSEGSAEDELFEQAVRLIVMGGHASTSMIQRKFKIGYTRAARLVDMMEEQGIVGPLDGAKPREILISKADLDNLFSRSSGDAGLSPAASSLAHSVQDDAAEPDPTGEDAPDEDDPFFED